MAQTQPAPLHKGQEGGVETVWDLNLVGVLTQEENALVDELTNNKPKDLAEVASRDEFLLDVLTPVMYIAVRNLPRKPAHRACSIAHRL